MAGIIGKKIGMTTYFNKEGKSLPVTLIQAGPCDVIQVKTEEKDGYNSVQLGYLEQKQSRISKALNTHFEKHNTSPKKKIVEFKNFENLKSGDSIDVSIFNEGELVDVTSTSKGKGFQGVVKRHGFSGVGGRTHGQHNRDRAPGSIGAASYPSRVFKGMKMAGQMGNKTVKVQNLKVLKIVKDDNILLLSGSVPGHRNSYVIIEK